MKKTRERDRTDESLQVERTKTDVELGRRRSDLESDADEARAHARSEADGSIRRARAEADRTREVSDAVTTERRREDEERRLEREQADARVLQEREEGQRALHELLRFERDSTDQQLGVERRYADDELASRDLFLGMVSHDLRTLLGGMALSAGILLRLSGEDLREQVRLQARQQQRLIARMNRLVGDLLDVVSIEAGRLRVEPAPHEVDALVREALEAFESLAAARRITLSGRVDEPSLVATFDHDRVLQVLANLLSNAIKFTPQGGRVDLEVERRGADLGFAVSDTGPGLAPDQAEAVFERFWQVSPRDRRGLGIGLFIARGIIEAHGGRIWMEPRPEGGSTFRFTLPAGEVAEAAGARQVGSAAR